MLGPLTDDELAAMPAKAKKDPETVALYQEKPFLEAYAAHTDRRVERTGYKAAIGADEFNWNTHGDLQWAFLKTMGLRPEHKLLEIGCGTGRLARKVVPYLGYGCYTGLDISSGALEAARRLASIEGWDGNAPRFVQGSLPTGSGPFDFVWAFSVFIHLPQVVMEGVMRTVALTMHPASRFCWSYVPEAQTYRSGVKQFRHALEDYKHAAEQAGLTFDDVPNWMEQAGFTASRATGHQRVALSVLKL